MASQRCPCPNPPESVTMYALQKAEIKIADRIKIANQCTLKEINYPGLSGGPMQSEEPFKWMRGAMRDCQSQSDLRERSEDAMLMALKLREVAISQEMQLI